MPSNTNIKQTASHAIETWWQRLGAPGYVCLAVGDPPKDFFFDQEKLDVARWIHGHEDQHLFFCPHTFAPVGQPAQLRRRKENSLPCSGLWADLDGVDPNKLGALEPTIAWMTSPKRYQGLWLTDGVVADISLNKRLTYNVGADKGGWCQTKLLRLPGSRNQKYRPAPLALLLWDDGPLHRIADLEEALPQLKERPKVHAASAHRKKGERGFMKASGLEPEQILAGYGIGGHLADELLHGQPNGEDRSRALWKFSCQLRERGVPAAEACVVLMGSAWSRGREDDVERVLEKVWSEEM
jgi:RepB DNA-primase from phage plasmid